MNDISPRFRAPNDFRMDPRDRVCVDGIRDVLGMAPLYNDGGTTRLPDEDELHRFYPAMFHEYPRKVRR